MFETTLMELLHESSGSYDQSIVKGKRTKRPRQPSSSSETSMNTQEDEDMANCLILFARGGGSPSPACSSEESKHICPKFAEMEGKSGITYVYECKTCNRTFPSFQALGGHRASHKRLKLGTSDESSDMKKSPMLEFPVVKNTTVLSTQLPKKALVVESTKSKVHECAICGAEFGSGQALGGHMRRHRSIVPASNNNNINNNINVINVSEKSRNVFSLDLNLPAEPEDDHWQERFHRFSSSFSAAAAPLVDCHY